MSLNINIEKDVRKKCQKIRKNTQKSTKKLPYLLLFYLFKWRKKKSLIIIRWKKKKKYLSMRETLILNSYKEQNES